MLTGTKSSSPKQAFTLVELAVVIATLALLFVMLLPALASNTTRSLRAHCANNLRQIGAATLMYAQDNNDVFPTLKWREANPTYPYEMFRYTTPGVFSMGPYNLGLLWKTQANLDGRTYYCAANKRLNNNLTYEYYAVMAPWPYGVDPNVANAGYVRSGYSYFPQMKDKVTLVTALGSKEVPRVNNRTTRQPENSWIAVDPIKMSAVDSSKSMVVDAIFSTLDNIHHRDEMGRLAGLNAVFADGHVAWQDDKRIPDAFHPFVWAAIAGAGDSAGINLRYVMSLFEP